jgi:tetratricopeptide (TPR) repeat protein
MQLKYRLLFGEGHDAEAAREAEQALQYAEAHFGPGVPDTLQTMDDLVRIYHHMKRYDQARTLIERALTLCENNQGKDSRFYPILLSDLAENLRVREKYVEAEDTLQKALVLGEKGSNRDDPDVVGMILNNLGNLMSDQDRYSEAEPYLQRSLKLMEAKPGVSQREYAVVLYNLALVERKLGKYDDAQMLYERSLGVLEHAVGEWHADLVEVLEGLAKTYDLKGWKEEAQEARTRAQRIRSRSAKESKVSND